jgi:pyruvate dehydrogenase E1 component
MANLGGHDLPSCWTPSRARTHDRPVCFIAYTIKGFGLPLAGHKDNHAGLMTPPQMEVFRRQLASAKAMNGSRSRGWTCPRRRLRASCRRCPSRPRPPRFRTPVMLGAGALEYAAQRNVDPAGLWPADAHELAKATSGLCRPRRDHVARRDRLDQSRRLGQPARPLRARGTGRRVPAERIPSTFNWDLLAARASTWNWASPR